MVARPGFGALLAVAVVSCGDGDQASQRELPGLVVAVHPAARPIDLDAAASELAELVRAASQPRDVIGAALGAHHLEIETSIEVREGQAVVEQLTDRAVVDLAAGGDFHAVLTNSKDYGRDVFFVGGELYLRPRFGKFHRRPPVDDGEPTRVQGEVAGALGAYLELAAPGLVARDGGSREVAGRPARIVTLAAGTGPRAAATTPQQAWRQGAVVKDAHGELALDAASGAPLAGQLDATIEFSRDGRHFAMTIAVRQTVSAIGAAPALIAPGADQIATATEVPRELAEREELLDGIAPPSARAPTPDNPTGAASATGPEP